MPDEIEEAAAVILRYFESRPQAADTAEGIAQWVVAAGDATRGMIETVEALELLVARGQLEAFTVAGRVVYRRRRLSTS